MTKGDRHDVPQSRSTARITAPITARIALRRATDAVHAELNDHPAFQGVLSGQADQAEYDRLLTRLIGFYRLADRAMQESLADAHERRGSYRYLPRSPQLAADLAATAATAATAETAAARADPACSFPELRSGAALAGAAYVLDGALLGGAILARAVQALPCRPGNTRFWRWCRDEGPAQWRRTLALIAREDRGEDSRAQMILSAHASFAAFAAAMETGPAHPRCD